MRTTDQMEQIIEAALIDSGEAYSTDRGGENAARLDFYLPRLDLHIEVKRMHSPRIADQMARALNVIAAQGEPAVRYLAGLIRRIDKVSAPTPPPVSSVSVAELEALAKVWGSEINPIVRTCAQELRALIAFYLSRHARKR
jgi:hypothetical protein